MMDRRPGSRFTRTTELGALLVLAAALVFACLRPPEGGAEAAEDTAAAGDAEHSAAVSGYYPPTWGDSSGADGKGGVKLSVGG
jgi:hypothetical protein